MSELETILQQNRTWAKARRSEEPGFFDDLAAGQDPDVLWIGCADSRVPPNQITGLPPGSLFVHRNIANLVLFSDPSFLACLEYAVEALEVDHVIVCGHTGCGGVGAAMEGTEYHHVADWIQEIQRVKRAHEDELEDIDDPQERVNRLSKLNVQAQVDNLSRTRIVRDAWQDGASLKLHGWLFQLETGELMDLDLTREG